MTSDEGSQILSCLQCLRFWFVEIHVDSILVPHGQHYLSTPYSIFLPAPGSAPLCPASTLQNASRFLYLFCSPSSIYNSLLHSCQWHRSAPAGERAPKQIWIQTPLRTPPAALSHSGCCSPVPCITCVQSYLCHTAPVSNKHPQQPGAWAAHQLLGSTAQGTPHNVTLGAGSGDTPQCHTGSWHTQVIQGLCWSVVLCCTLGYMDGFSPRSGNLPWQLPLPLCVLLVRDWHLLKAVSALWLADI